MAQKIFFGNVVLNKRNKQMSVVLPKKKLNLALLHHNVPKRIKFKIEDIEW